jgi:hypothetical protein
MDVSSTPTVSWDYDVGGGTTRSSMMSMEQQMLRRRDEEEPEPPLPIPPRTVMAARWAFRQGIREETLQHRRIHAHPPISYHQPCTADPNHSPRSVAANASAHSGTDVATGRNICLILRDRELYGAQRLTHHPRRRLPSLAPVASFATAPSRTTFVAAATTTATKTTTTGPGCKRRNDEVDSEPNEHGATAMDTDVPEAGSSIKVNGGITPRAAPGVAANAFAAATDSGQPRPTEAVEEPTTATTKPPLLQRVSYPMSISHEVRTFAEYCSVIRYHSAFFHHLGGEDERGEQGERPASSRAVSTISIAFSPDSQTMASTHGDHTVKITCCFTGGLLETLDGHPRTPWTVKYHPTNSHIVASGCLGHQVRLWNWKEKSCLQMIRLEYAIISLSFHPAGQVLAIANGTRLHFWGYETNTGNTTTTTNTNNNNNSLQRNPQQQQQQQRQGSAPNQLQQQQQPRSYRGMLTEVEQRHMLRCVHFPPGGNTIIVGGVNPTAEDPRRTGRSGISGGGMSFYLRLWDFDVDAALHPFGAASDLLGGAAAAGSGTGNTSGGPSGLGVRRRAISNVRSICCNEKFSGIPCW